MRISDWSSDVCSSDLLAIGGSFVAFLTYGKNLWALILFQRSHGLSAGETGLMLGVTIGVAGIVGTWLGGYLADRFGSVDRRPMLTTPAIGMALGAPILFLGYWVHEDRQRTRLNSRHSCASRMPSSS